MKKRFLYFFLIILFLTLALILFIFELSKNNSTPIPPSIPTPTPVKTIIKPKDPIFNQEEEKKVEGNYALDRSLFLQQKPWVLKLPLKNNDYFVFYDVEKDEVVVKIYYAIGLAEKNNQINLVKQAALDEIKTIGVDLNAQKIVFIEKQKTN